MRYDLLEGFSLDKLPTTVRPMTHELLQRAKIRRQALQMSKETKFTMVDYGAVKEQARGAEGDGSKCAVYERKIKDLLVSSIQYSAGEFFCKLIEYFECLSYFELGIAAGMSTCYAAAGLCSNALKMVDDARIVALDGCPACCEYGKASVDWVVAEYADRVKANYVEGPFLKTVPDALKLNKIEIAFIDGFHRRKATTRHYKMIAEAMPEGGIILVDDIKWSGEMKEAWNDIRKHPRTKFAIIPPNVGRLGLCLV